MLLKAVMLDVVSHWLFFIAVNVWWCCFQSVMSGRVTVWGCALPEGGKDSVTAEMASPSVNMATSAKVPFIINLFLYSQFISFLSLLSSISYTVSS